MSEEKKYYAKCSFSGCMEKAEWTMGTWQCCDKHAEQYIHEDEPGEFMSRWGSSKRIGQEAILKHNLEFNLKSHLVEINETPPA